MFINNKTKNSKKNKPRKSRKRQYRGKGPVNEYVKQSVNSGDKQNKKDQEHTSYKTKIKVNDLEYEIEYIIATNLLFLKDINPIITPLFNVNKIPNKKDVTSHNKFRCYIQILNQNKPHIIDLIACFVQIKDPKTKTANWYVITTNGEFYVVPKKWFIISKNKISIPENEYNVITNDDMKNAQNIPKINNGLTIKLTGKYERIIDGKIFDVLNQFMLSQMSNAVGKQLIVYTVFNEILDNLFGI